MSITMIRLGVVGSTFDEARAWAGANPGARAVIVAAEQTSGRGRLGRTWQSPPGGCWMTLVWPLEHPGSSGVAGLLAAVAAAEVIESVLGEAPNSGVVQIRWPNDLLIGGLKVGGVLGEVIGGRDEPVLLLGIGINVNNSIPNQGLRTPAIAIVDRFGKTELNLPAFIDTLVTAIAAGFERLGPGGLLESDRKALDARLAFRGESVRLEGAGAEGLLIGVDGFGRLLIEVDGELRAFSSGELSCRVVDDSRRV